MTLAYWTASFTAASQSKRGLRPLFEYIKKLSAPFDESRGGTAVLGLMKEMQAKGAPVNIKRLN